MLIFNPVSGPDEPGQSLTELETALERFTSSQSAPDKARC